MILEDISVPRDWQQAIDEAQDLYEQASYDAAIKKLLSLIWASRQGTTTGNHALEVEILCGAYGWGFDSSNVKVARLKVKEAEKILSPLYPDVFEQLKTRVEQLCKKKGEARSALDLMEEIERCYTGDNAEQPNYVGIMIALGETYPPEKYLEREACLMRALAFLEESKEYSGRLLSALNVLVGFYLQNKEYEKGLGCLKRIQALEEKKCHTYTEADICDRLESFSLIYNHLGRTKEALLLCKSYINSFEKQYGKDEREMAGILQYMGQLLGKLGEHEKAESYLRKAVAICEDQPKTYGPFTARYMVLVADIHATRGNIEDAASLYEQAIKLYLKYPQRTPIDISDIVEKISMLYKNDSRVDEQQLSK